MTSDMASIIVGILALIGTIIGYRMTSSKITALFEYRLTQLENKVDKHNNVIERTYELEEQVSLIKAEDQRQNNRISAIENDMKGVNK